MSYPHSLSCPPLWSGFILTSPKREEEVGAPPSPSPRKSRRRIARRSSSSCCSRFIFPFSPCSTPYHPNPPAICPSRPPTWMCMLLRGCSDGLIVAFVYIYFVWFPARIPNCVCCTTQYCRWSSPSSAKRLVVKCCVVAFWLQRQCLVSDLPVKNRGRPRRASACNTSENDRRWCYLPSVAHRTKGLFHYRTCALYCLFGVNKMFFHIFCRFCLDWHVSEEGCWELSTVQIWASNS